MPGLPVYIKWTTKEVGKWISMEKIKMKGLYDPALEMIKVVFKKTPIVLI